LTDKDGKPLIRNIRLPLKLIVVPEAKVDEILKDEWEQVSGAGLSSTLGLYHHIITKYIGISRKAVKTFVDNQEVKQIKSRSIIEFTPVQPIVRDYPRQLFCMDLADMRRFSKQNSNVGYLLVLIDHFSKFLWLIPLTSRALSEVTHELNKIFYSEGPPESLLADNEFNAEKKEMRELFKKWKINSKSTQPFSPWQNGLSERTVGTIKKRIDTFMSQNSTKRFVDALPLIVHGYNNTVHSTTKFTPFEVYRLGIGQNELYERVKKNTVKSAVRMIESSRRKIAHLNNQVIELQIGDWVRISVFTTTTGRKAIQGLKKRPLGMNMFSKEMYRVVNIKIGNVNRREPDRFKIVDDDGNVPVNNKKETYFRFELLRVDKDQLILKKNVKVDLKFSQKDRHLPKKIEKASKLQEKVDQQLLEEEVKAQDLLITKESINKRVRKRTDKGLKLKKAKDLEAKRERKEVMIDESKVDNVAKILRHAKQGKAMSFLVRWEGKLENEDSWERAGAFIGEEARKILRDYREANGLVKKRKRKRRKVGNFLD